MFIYIYRLYNVVHCMYIKYIISVTYLSNMCGNAMLTRTSLTPAGL